MRRMICFDMDMTLLDHGKKAIPLSALKAIEQLKERGHYIVIASGRDMDNELSRPWAEYVKPHAIVHSNGQKVTVGEKVLKERFMERDLIRKLVAFAQEKEFCLGFNIGSSGCYVHDEIIREKEKKVFKEPEREFLPPENLLTHSFYSLAVFGRDSEETPRIARAIENRFPELKCPLFSGNEGADVIERKASKAEGIRVLLEHYEMDFDQVVAFGDSMNDWEMIQAAGIGVAMGNAVPALKEVADFVTKPIGEDGVLHGLTALGLLGKENANSLDKRWDLS